MKETKKEMKGTENTQIAELLAELAQAKAALAAESAAKSALEAALENAKKSRTRKSATRPAHVEFMKSAPARAALAIAATGKQATALVPAYLAATLLAQASHATGAARQTVCQVSRAMSYTAGVLPEMLPAEVADRFYALKADIQTVAGWIELRGLGDDYNIIDKEDLQAITDTPERAPSIFAAVLNDLRLQSLEVQRKAFKPEDFAKIEADSKALEPWNFEDWGVITEAK